MDEKSQRSIGYILSVLLASGAMLYFTLPTSHGGPDCAVVGDTLRGLGHVELYRVDGTLVDWHAAGMPGSRDSFAVADDGSQQSYYVRTTSTRGVRSCLSNVVTLHGSASVEPSPGPGVRWYDVTGRRVKPPTTPGVYFWRDGQRHGKAVILR